MTDPWNIPIFIHGYRLQKTCYACPEQYDVYAGEHQVAYLRLRHGCFLADVPKCGGKNVYGSYPKGDGMFEDDERQQELTNAVLAVQKYYLNREWSTE